MDKIYQYIEDNPVIVAVKNDKELNKALKLKNKVVFVLYGDICNISNIVEKLKENNKKVIVHIDLITGLSNREIAIDFIAKNTRTDGIITTRPNNIKRAKELGLFTVLRFFLIDSMSYENIDKTLRQVSPDMVEILPGLMPKIIEKIYKRTNTPIIAGGLIIDKEDAINALNAGAVGISTTNNKVWEM